ncbi:hypothetical protein AAY473_017041 [Plecturocebus cupreus]
MSWSVGSKHLSGTEFPSRCPGWSAMARSQLTTASASLVQVILLPHPPSFPKCWDYRCEPPCPAEYSYF